MNQWGKYGVFVCVFNWCRCHFLVHLILVSNVIIKVIQQKQKQFVRKKKSFTCIGEICIKQWYNLYMLLCRVVWLYCNCFMTKKLEGKTGHHDELVLLTINLMPSKFYVQMSFYLAVLQNKFHESCSYIFCCTCSLKE